MNDSYADIINLPHHISKTRPQMSMKDRAAQFSPFAALTGYDAAIKETGRLTDEKIELDEEALSNLNMKFQILFIVINKRFRANFHPIVCFISSKKINIFTSYSVGNI